SFIPYSQHDAPAGTCHITVFCHISTWRITLFPYSLQPYFRYTMLQIHSHSFCLNQLCEFCMPKAILLEARSYSPFFTMTTEVGCTIDVSGQLKDSDNIDWYNSETDTPPLPRLATSAFLAITTAFQMVDGQKWLIMLQPKP
ncbi:hypothetical protein K443DRAFT_93875, partial [Laccaria amethystina LaAM-08-1]